MILPLLLLGLLAMPQQSQLPPYLDGPVAKLNAGDADGALHDLEALVADDPEDGLAWYFLGLAHHGAGRMQEAMSAHLLARALIHPGHPLRTNATYNMACAYALTGHTERALQWLERARQAGFRNPGLLASDTDLASLRDDPRFTAFTRRTGIGQVRPGSVTVDSLTGLLPGGTGGVTLAPDGGLYVADFGNQVRHVSADGDVSLFATGFVKAADCTVDSEGWLLQVDHGQSRLMRVSPEGEVRDTGVSGLQGPVGIDIADDGTIYVTNYQAESISRVVFGEPAETITSRGLLNGPNGLAAVGDLLYVCNFNDGCVLSVDRHTGEQHFVAELPGGGNGHLAWSDGALSVTDRKGQRILRVTPAGEVSVVAGSGTQGTADGDGAQATFSLPNGIAVSPDGKTLWVNDNLGVGTSSVVRRIRL
ncbi:MAG: tetratricopeptide repeat protein [Planctomycetes bacterium]|nr:tetratricopeptide repeat protein [Planctomycetota bacterium]